ncbi:dihydrofolate synthase / folylpolyglutamate synthase [Filimonas lacunae]|uniref:Dihydrofolate synthase/folylpolyglutamate synthase n=1 Tax=Filimonas lacunae TaxID=477680 RepID=A0A173MKD9_9BACT|nr:folylpolyglutamate synthase/dihydrofolate synthase family protein [Filimonas lacunae]BAV07871.1 dihydrofolate synthase [Filimonas lacunae]SIT05849.1 dihydrofolate synthase / folylpolyglutamate synthase [Filimonas lacunae]
MNYQETLDYLFHKLPMFSRIGAAAFKKDLTNTIALCDALDNPQQHFISIHIAGTNGKGSVSHMLASVLQSAGYKTGLYTSPHLKDFRERIKVNGELCTEQFVIDFTQKIQPQIEALEPSFFEITVAMAFDWFAQQKVDIAIIETGLGGRLDSTNIITPTLSIITNIGYDHMNMLGDTLPLIAGEKAGIIKQGVSVVIGETHTETTPVFEQTAAAIKAPILWAQQLHTVTDWQYQHHHLQVTIEHVHSGERKTYALDLPGLYQRKNVLSVITAVEELRRKNWNISEEQLAHGLQHVKKQTGLHGRWELIQQHPTVILDVCHNEDGIQQLVQQLELTTYNELHIVMGMVKDKDIEKVLALLPTTAHYYFTRAQIERALPENELAAKAAIHGLQGHTYPDVNTALAQAKQKAHEKDLIIVCGSVFLVGEVA